MKMTSGKEMLFLIGGIELCEGHSQKKKDTMLLG